MSQAEYAALSVLCYSSAHDDIMRVILQEASQGSSREALECIAIRSEIITCLNQAMHDPKRQTTDGTIMSVMNILYSEIMGQESRTVIIHQQGLQKMVHQRGGLDNLGGDGNLASALATYEPVSFPGTHVG